MKTPIREDFRMLVASEMINVFPLAAFDSEKVFGAVDQFVMPVFDDLVEQVGELAALLRMRNRLNGRASETIGRLRADIARLRLERAEWRGTVNGDVLVEVLAASAPEQWTPEDRRRHAEHVIEAMQASGIEVRRAVRFARKFLNEPVRSTPSGVDGGR